MKYGFWITLHWEVQYNQTSFPQMNARYLSHCVDGVVTIRDGDIQGPVLFQLTNQTALIPYIASTGQNLTVEYNGTNSNFLAMYYSGQCTETVIPFVGYGGYFDDGSFALGYAPILDCFWLLQVPNFPPFVPITLTFPYFDANLNNDYAYLRKYVTVLI